MADGFQLGLCTLTEWRSEVRKGDPISFRELPISPERK